MALGKLLIVARRRRKQKGPWPSGQPLSTVLPTESRPTGSSSLSSVGFSFQDSIDPQNREPFYQPVLCLHLASVSVLAKSDPSYTFDDLLVTFADLSVCGNFIFFFFFHFFVFFFTFTFSSHYCKAWPLGGHTINMIWASIQ